MGFYSTVVGVPVVCSCGAPGLAEVQFSYGGMWSYEYKLGDSLRWDGVVEGEPGAKKIVAWGSGRNICKVCGAVSDADYDVIIRNDAIEAVEPMSRRDRYSDPEHHWIRDD